MDLSKRIGITFVAFTAFALALNLVYRDNPDFWLNVSMESILMVMFAISAMTHKVASAVIQISCLAVAAAIAPMSPGGPIFSSVILVMAMILSYAYGWFRLAGLAKAGGSFLIIYTIMAFNLSKMDEYGMSVLIRAFAWTSFLAVFCFVLWLIVEELDKEFHMEREDQLLRLNDKLIKLNREILDSGGCDDATGKSSRI